MIETHRDRGFSLIEVLVVLGVMTIIFGIAVPAVLASLDNLKLDGAARSVQGDMQNARLKAVSSNRPMRFRFNCPGARQYRAVELIGTPAAPDARDTAADRCSPTTYPFPPADASVLTRPNNDGPVRFLNENMSFTASQTIEFWPNGTAHVDNGSGTPWPAIGSTDAKVTLTYKSKTKSITVNGVGKIQIQ